MKGFRVCCAAAWGAGKQLQQLDGDQTPVKLMICGSLNHIRTTFFNSGITLKYPQGYGDARNWLLLVRLSQHRTYRLAMHTGILRQTQTKTGYTQCQCR